MKNYAISLGSTFVLLFALSLRLMPRATVPAHLSGHKVYAEDELVDAEQRQELMGIIREMKQFMSNVDQAKVIGFVPKYENLGEGVPLNAEGSCDHPYLFPNADNSICILPERIDVGRHFVSTGGLEGRKEGFQDLISRVSSFQKITVVKDMDQYPLVKSLFDSEKFQKAAKSVCPQDRTYLDPFQFNFIFNLPGQTVAMHLDAPYFWGASRSRFPQWLLVAMVFSGLFLDRFINQIQVVTYLHEWSVDPAEVANSSSSRGSSGGDFVFYNNATSVGVVNSLPGSGSIVDGSKVLHAAKIYRPEVKAPFLDKNKLSQLVYVGNDDWELQADGEVLQRYKTDDLRISMVYRARCFADEAEAQRYAALPEEEMLTLETVMEVFKKDMVSRGVTTPAKLASMEPLAFLFLIMDTYITYPLPPWEFAWVPFNYCALPKQLPWTEPFFKMIC
mmetsp:Transcript_15918/g.26782  ORF Transcript_15918/g.26782 Transcript_15918/m.26782 type:complete len:447 (-) Transcript_15918:90-1430(-)